MVFRQQHADRLQFQNYLIINYNISVEATDNFTSKLHFNRPFNYSIASGIPQRSRKCSAINALKKTHSQFVVDVEERSKNAVSELAVREVARVAVVLHNEISGNLRQSAAKIPTRDGYLLLDCSNAHFAVSFDRHKPVES